MTAVSSSSFVGVDNKRESFYLSSTTDYLYVNGRGGTDGIDAGANTSSAYLVGGGDRDVIYGGSADDVLIGDSSPNDNSNTGVNDTSALADFLSGGAGNDIIYAGGGSNWVDGGAGDDSINGGNGNEFLQGGAGNDEVFGGAGNDVIYGGTTTTAMQTEMRTAYFGGQIFTDFDLRTDAASASGFSGVPQSQSLTNTGNDRLDGGDGNDTIYGQDGADTLLGGEGADLLVGGAGADALDGGNGSDTASYVDAASAVTANLSDSSLNGGDASGDTYTSIENLTGTAFADTLTGDAGANRLTGEGGKDAIAGGAGNDKIYGGADNDGLFGNDGDDYIVGGSGNDRLGGGAGSDVLLFDSAFSSRTNIDTITDFTNNKSQNDVLWLENAIFTNFASTGAIAAGNFVSNASGTAVDSNDYLVYNSSTGNLYYDADGSGAGTATLFAQLSTKPALSYQDFLIV